MLFLKLIRSGLIYTRTKRRIRINIKGHERIPRRYTVVRPGIPGRGPRLGSCPAGVPAPLVPRPPSGGLSFLNSSYQYGSGFTRVKTGKREVKGVKLKAKFTMHTGLHRQKNIEFGSTTMEKGKSIWVNNCTA